MLSSGAWFWNCVSDCRNLNRRDLLAFPVNIAALPETQKTALADIGRRYARGLAATSRMMPKSGKRLETFDYERQKPTLDEADAILADHFGLDPAERSFVLTYDLKYRRKTPT